MPIFLNIKHEAAKDKQMIGSLEKELNDQKVVIVISLNYKSLLPVFKQYRI